MNGPVIGPQMWTRRRLWTVAAMATLAQIGLIYWASDWTPVQPRKASARPAVQLVAFERSDWLAATDPRIFSSAHPQGFSGLAWLKLHSVDYAPERTNGAARWLTLSPEQLGQTFREYVRTNSDRAFEVAVRSTPSPTTVDAAVNLPILAQSVVEAEGALAERGWVHIAPPPSQTNSDVLPASEVHLLVDARGNPISAVLTRSSGSKAADQLAVKLAREAQFNTDRDALRRLANEPDAGVISGRLIFRWHTVPPGSTNFVNPR